MKKREEKLINRNGNRGKKELLDLVREFVRLGNIIRILKKRCSLKSSKISSFRDFHVQSYRRQHYLKIIWNT